jgi:hypothetical protein
LAVISARQCGSAIIANTLVVSLIIVQAGATRAYRQRLIDLRYEPLQSSKKEPFMCRFQIGDGFIKEQYRQSCDKDSANATFDAKTQATCVVGGCYMPEH